MSTDREAAIREALDRLVAQDRFEMPYAVAARVRLDGLLAELAAAREQNQTLRKALDAAMQYVDPKDRDWIERLGGGPWA